MCRLSPLLAALAALLALAVVAQAVLHAQTGPLPLAGVFEVHLLAVATVAALLALAGALGGGRARAWTRLVSLAVLVLAVVSLGDELWSPTPDAATGPTSELRVLTWNLDAGGRAATATVAGIAALDADLVALQELTPEAATAIEADPILRARYPYRILEPDQGVDGMGLLAKRPLVTRGSERAPLILRAGLLLDGGRMIEVLDVHPYPPDMGTVARLPVSLDTRRRDEDLGVIGGRVVAMDDPAWALVVGDLNTAPGEPSLAALADGLTDAHAAAGTGPGFTWRPSALEGLGVGVLRIDHVLTGTWLTPVAATTDCSIAGDHCRLMVTLRIAAPPAP